MEPVVKSSIKKFFPKVGPSLDRFLFNLFYGLLFLVFLSFTALPLMRSAGQAWAGFFYSPFYTVNIFTDNSQPAYLAGLRPEDRVIQAGSLPGQWLRINYLTQEIKLASTREGNLTLVYELGRNLVDIKVRVEQLSLWRLLEKAIPFFIGASMLAVLALRLSASFGFKLFAGVASLALLATPDYFLGPGGGLESGFVFFDGPEGLFSSGKWATFLYAPLLKFVSLVGIGFSLKYFSEVPRMGTRRTLLSFGALTLTGFFIYDFTSFIYEALKTAQYNNPDYLNWQWRGLFWAEWLPLMAILLVLAFKKGNRWFWPGLAGLFLFLGGFLVPVVFDIALPGPGPQWYSLGLPYFFLIINGQFKNPSLGLNRGG